MSRKYRVIIAKTKDAISVVANRVAGDPWTVLENTTREFASLDVDNDPRLDDDVTGDLVVARSAWVALAFQDE
jgi:uncharacterized protein (DUF736 family)